MPHKAKLNKRSAKKAKGPLRFRSTRFTGTRTPDGHYGFSSVPHYNTESNLVGRRDGQVDQKGFDHAKFLKS